MNLKKQRVQALKEYAKYYGPLTLDTATTQMDYWKWINGSVAMAGRGMLIYVEL